MLHPKRDFTRFQSRRPARSRARRGAAVGSLIMLVSVTVAVSAALLLRPHQGRLVTHAAAAASSDARMGPSASATAEPPSPSPSHEPSPLEQLEAEVRAQAAIVVDVDSGKVIWARDPVTPRAPASLTKIVTAMVAMDLASLDRKVIVTRSSDVAAMRRIEPASTVMGLTAGEVLTVRELMYGLFLRSGNDAAETLAGGIVSRSRFMDLMNAKAAGLGMRSSHFTSPVGLDEPGMTSSPNDLALAASAIVKRYPQLLAISGTASIDLPASPLHKQYSLDNYNRLVKPGPYSYAGATGMKTAFTDDAGPCMVATAARNGRRLVVVAMHSDNFFADARRMFDYGFAQASAG